MGGRCTVTAAAVWSTTVYGFVGPAATAIPVPGLFYFFAFSYFFNNRLWVRGTSSNSNPSIRPRCVYVCVCVCVCVCVVYEVGPAATQSQYQAQVCFISLFFFFFFMGSRDQQQQRSQFRPRQGILEKKVLPRVSFYSKYNLYL